MEGEVGLTRVPFDAGGVSLSSAWHRQGPDHRARLHPLPRTLTPLRSNSLCCTACSFWQLYCFLQFLAFPRALHECAQTLQQLRPGIVQLLPRVALHDLRRIPGHRLRLCSENLDTSGSRPIATGVNNLYLGLSKGYIAKGACNRAVGIEAGWWRRVALAHVTGERIRDRRGREGVNVVDASVCTF